MDVHADVAEVEDEVLSERLHRLEAPPVDHAGAIGELALWRRRPHPVAGEWPQGAGQVVERVALGHVRAGVSCVPRRLRGLVPPPAAAPCVGIGVARLDQLLEAVDVALGWALDYARRVAGGRFDEGVSRRLRIIFGDNISPK